MEQVSGQVKEIRKLVEQNQDTLLALHTNRDKPDVFNDLMKRLKSKWQKRIQCKIIYMYSSNVCLPFVYALIYIQHD